MFNRRSKDRYALLVDIGSGSVGIAVCHSPSSDSPTIIWSHREHIPLRNIESIDDSSKAIITALFNNMIEFEGTGRAALKQYANHARIKTMQVTVAAPWAYTTTREVTFEQDEPFEIIPEIINDLATAAGEQAVSEFNELHTLESLGIAETSRCTLATHANGYRLYNPNNQLARTISVTQATTLVRTELLDAVNEMRHKLFASCDLAVTSFVLANHIIVQEQHKIENYCLVDVTNEATEIGIVRDGALRYSTHIAYGRASVAREIALVTKVPLHEAFTSFPTQEQIAANSELQAVFSAYIKKVTELFKETGDRLMIPKTIFLEVDTGLADSFIPLITTAGKKAGQGKVHVSLIQKSLGAASSSICTDVALLVGSSFFHTNPKRGHFEYL